MAVFGLQVSEAIISTPRLASNGIREAMMVGTEGGTDAANHNTPVGINSVTDFTTKFPTAKTSSLEGVRTFFNNNPSGILSYFPCFKAGVTETGDAAIVAHLQAGLAILDKRQDLSLRFIVCPEMDELTAQSDRTTIYTAIHNVAVKKDWLFFVNSSIGVDTKTKALTERALYASPLGHASYFFGRYTNNNDVDCAIAPYVAAIALKRSVEESPFKPPAGARYPLSNVKKLLYYIDSEADYTELLNNGINIMHDIPRYGKCNWGARTMSNDKNLVAINTRMAISVVVSRLEESLIPYLFESYDPQGATGREIRRIIESVMNTAYLDGAFSGATPETAYRIIEQEVAAPQLADGTPTIPLEPANPTTPPTNPQAARDKLYTIQRIYAHFVGATERIEVRLFHTDNPTVFAA